MTFTNFIVILLIIVMFAGGSALCGLLLNAIERKFDDKTKEDKEDEK